MYSVEETKHHNDATNSQSPLEEVRAYISRGREGVAGKKLGAETATYCQNRRTRA
jgi:hypothetical protein